MLPNTTHHHFRFRFRAHSSTSNVNRALVFCQHRSLGSDSYLSNLRQGLQRQSHVSYLIRRLSDCFITILGQFDLPSLCFAQPMICAGYNHPVLSILIFSTAPSIKLYPLTSWSIHYQARYDLYMSLYLEQCLRTSSSHQHGLTGWLSFGYSISSRSPSFSRTL